MKKPSQKPLLSRLSDKAKQSSFSTFLSRTSLSVLAAPVGGYLIGYIVDALRPGEISWAMTLLFIGFCFGCTNLWCWMKRPST